MRFAPAWMLPPFILLIRLGFVFAQPLRLPGLPRNRVPPSSNSPLARALCFLGLPFAQTPCFLSSPFARASCLPTPYPPALVRQARACLQAVSARKPPSLRWHIRQASRPFGLCVRQGAHLPVRLSAAFAGVSSSRKPWSISGCRVRSGIMVACVAIAQVFHFDRLRVRQGACSPNAAHL